MVEPTEVELGTLTDMDSVCDYAGISDEHRALLYAALGCIGANLLRPVGMIAGPDFDAIVMAVRENGNPLPAYGLAAMKLVGRLCRLTSGAEVSRTAAATAAAVAAAAQPPPVVQQAANTKVGLIKLDTVLDQGLSDEINVTTEQDMTAGYEKYKERMGKMPSEEREPSIEQYSGVKHLLALSAPPYADFSVFGPHSVRLRKRMRLNGFFLASDGSLQKCELFGPANFEDWSRSYRVLATILLMLAAVMPEELDAYHDHIRDLAHRYGLRCWATIYQADVRCRQERMQSIRRRGAALLVSDAPAAARAGYDPEVPWRYVWSEAVNETAFWIREVQEKCFLLLTKIASEESVLDGDVVTSNTRASLAAQASAGSGQSPRERSPRRAPDGQSKGSPLKKVKQHNAGDDGLMRTNRSGKELCKNFQEGRCSADSGIQCPADPRRVHQCAKCLSTEHGSNHPTKCDGPARQQPGGRGRGGGKGSKGGKGRGGGRG